MATTEKINLNDSMLQVVMKMSGGNPGAMRVCKELLARPGRPEGVVLILHADDMGIRGPSLWIAYKDFAGEDIEVLAKALIDRDQAMVDKIRAAGGQAWTGGRS